MQGVECEPQVKARMTMRETKGHESETTKKNGRRCLGLTHLNFIKGGGGRLVCGEVRWLFHVHSLHDGTERHPERGSLQQRFKAAAKHTTTPSLSPTPLH
jgi:hypothetical protein